MSRLNEVLEKKRRAQVRAAPRRQRHRGRDPVLQVGLLLILLSVLVLFSAMWWWPASPFTHPEATAPKFNSGKKDINRSVLSVNTVSATPDSTGPAPAERSVPPSQSSSSAAASSHQEVGSGKFVVLEAVKDGDAVRFRRHRMDGIEHSRAHKDARRRVPSMNQRDFPEPESGCGPTAIVNWMLWLQQEGVLRKPIEGANPRVLALSNFRSVEREFYGLRGARRRLYRGGSQIDEITATMDRLVYRLSEGALRMHHQHFHAPLRIEDWLEFTSGFRAGILITRVVEDPVSRRLGGYHAVSLVAGDRRGGVMLNNWGENVYGSLRNERDGQFFYPANLNQPALKIESAVCFIPFLPAEDIPVVDLEPGDFAGRPSLPLTTRNSVSPAPSTSTRTPAVVNTFHTARHPSATEGPKAWVYAVTNRSTTAQTVYLRTFKGRFDQGKQFFPTDIRAATRAGGRYIPFGDRARLLLAPGETRHIWFQFDHLQVRTAPPLQLVEHH